MALSLLQQCIIDWTAVGNSGILISWQLSIFLAEITTFSSLFYPLWLITPMLALRAGGNHGFQRSSCKREKSASFPVEYLPVTPTKKLDMLMFIAYIRADRQTV